MKVRILFLTVLGLVISACSITKNPPSPEVVPGVYIQSGFEFYHWKEGLTVMIWHDGIKNSGCKSSTRRENYSMQCFGVSEQDQRFDWFLETKDGETARFSINDQLFNLKDGTLFIIENSDDGLDIAQLCRNLSQVAANAEDVIEYGLSDSTVREFIQNQANITGCISSYYTSRANSPDKDVSAAQGALKKFFAFLNAGEYERAADFYGGSYSVMQDQNPDLNPDDHAALFRNACLVNGAQCLEIQQITFLDQPSPHEYRFIVKFSNEDGSLFRSGPCCGDDSIQDIQQTDFTYTVRFECTGNYRILDMPVYLP